MAHIPAATAAARILEEVVQLILVPLRRGMALVSVYFYSWGWVGYPRQGGEGQKGVGRAILPNCFQASFWASKAQI